MEKGVMEVSYGGKGGGRPPLEKLGSQIESAGTF